MNNIYEICHDRVRYDLVSSNSVHWCTVCGRKWYCELPPLPKVGEKYREPYWYEAFSWAKVRAVLRSLRGV